MKKCFVGFDTSNYTTSAAICDEDGAVVANFKLPLPVAQGQRGLRQSDAVFAHTKNLPAITDMLKDKLTGYTPIAVGVSTTPRSVADSYMPCFLCGEVAAHAFAAPLNLPIYNTAHQNGHVMAAIYSSGAEQKLLSGRFLAFHVSGGTTEALLVTPTETDFDITLVGQTNDINAGQAIDRVGVMMGLKFPCGRELETLASLYDGKTEKKRICVENCACSLSGLENMAQKLYSDTGDKQKVAAFVFDFLRRTLSEMTRQVLEKYGDMSVLYAGGVMSNKLMRAELGAKYDAYFAEPEFSADNAAGVALLCRRKFLKGEN